MLVLGSRSALMENSWTCFFSNLAFQMFCRKWPVTQIKENSSEGSRSRFRWRIWFVETWGMSGMEEDRKLRRYLPTPLLKLHQKNACGRSSASDLSQSLQRGDGDLSLKILWTLSWVAKSPCRSLHRKENMSDHKPLSPLLLNYSAMMGYFD